MKTRTSTKFPTKLLTKKITKIVPLLAITLLFAACSQQQSSVDAAIPSAGGGVKTGGAGANSGPGTSSGNAGGANTQGVKTGSGAGSHPTGSGGGYQAGTNGQQGNGQRGNGQGNNQYYDYGNGNGNGNRNRNRNGNGNGNGNRNGTGSSGKEYTLANLKNPNSLLSKRIIYFDYNQATINPKYQAVLDAHAKLLAKNPHVDIRLEGHADERGTREYNVALSEERAKAVQWIMRSKGVNSSQSEVIAYGEERPAVVDSGEKSWAKNRRVEIKYPGR